MVSRRELILTSFALGSAKFAGCLDRSETTRDGFVQLKGLQGVQENEQISDIILVKIQDDEDNVETHTTKPYDKFFDTPSKPTIDEETHNQLEQEFSNGLQYILGICWKDADEATGISCRNERTDRNSFNNVNVFDRLRVKINNNIEILESETPSEPRAPDWA